MVCARKERVGPNMTLHSRNGRVRLVPIGVSYVREKPPALMAVVCEN